MGSRYGVKTRKRHREVREKSSAMYESPIIHKETVYRIGTSKWTCSSTGYTFAGGAYQPETDVGATARKTVETLRSSSKNQKPVQEESESN